MFHSYLMGLADRISEVWCSVVSDKYTSLSLYYITVTIPHTVPKKEIHKNTKGVYVVFYI